MLSEGYNNTVRRVGISAAVVLTVVAVSAGAPVTPNETITFEPGLRHAREGTVTVTDIDCSKIMYAEDETATCTARFENKSDRNRMPSSSSISVRSSPEASAVTWASDSPSAGTVPR